MPDHPDTLSEQEQTLLRLLAQGQTLIQIAETLKLDLPHTWAMLKHLRNIFDATSNLSLITAAQKLGFL